MELTAQRLGWAFAPIPAARGALLSAAAIVGLAAAEGGTFPWSWRVGGVVLGAVSCLLAVWTPTRRTATSTALLALLIALALLSFASAAWSVAPSASVLDGQRTLFYCIALASFVLAGEGLVAGVLMGAVAVGAWALLERVVEGATVDRFEGRLLTGPLGYANGLGALLAVGAVLSIVLALKERRAAFIAPLAVLLPALTLTNSRGSIAALVMGVAVGAPMVAGRRLLAAVAAGSAACLLAVLLAFTPAVAGDRAAYWSGARATIASRPFDGTGAGTFGLVHQQAPYAHDAHSLYLQTFSELGVAGLLLAIGLFGLPLAVAIRGGLATPAAGLATLALHSGIDWDWQLPAVTVAALALAAAAARQA